MTGENIEYGTRNIESRSEILRCAQNDPAPNYPRPPTTTYEGRQRNAGAGGKSLFGTGQAEKWIPACAGMT